jgi:glyoxylase-like metal-dependent hydrolase (beta-lactamase superfamily II)
VEHIIGLKQVERFFLRLRHLLSDRDMEEIRAMVESSQELSADLVRFYSELGNNLEVADVFEKVLALASMAGTRIGERFSAREMPPLVLGGGVRFYGFRMPTSENVYVFRHEDELTMIDTGYGAYYDDIKRLLKKKSLDPAEVRRIFISHADADHAGASGYFAREFGARVFMHPASKAIIDNINRGHGAEGRMLSLNRYFSRLVNKFTRCLYPRHIRYFPGTPRGKVGAFSVIDTFSIGDLEFQVLESLGGHVQGQVFFLNQSHGLLFTSDYLIQKGSLSREDRDSLGVYSYLLISPNIDRQVYREETTALNSMIEGLARERKEALLVFPGHGDYYPSGA